MPVNTSVFLGVHLNGIAVTLYYLVFETFFTPPPPHTHSQTHTTPVLINRGQFVPYLYIHRCIQCCQNSENSRCLISPFWSAYKLKYHIYRESMGQWSPYQDYYFDKNLIYCNNVVTIDWKTFEFVFRLQKNIISVLRPLNHIWF